jgi:2-C-methyl-D-erythritol 2,4-cyclodiphosphate synthase
MSSPARIPDLRIGFGYDVHRIVAGRELVLGGVRIPWDRGLLGHSDADVLLHAVMDAILGALALGDIGHWFPDTDPVFKGAASTGLLARILRSPQLQGWRIVNVDATLLAEKPKIAPHHETICQSLAAQLGLPRDCVSVKATTLEKLGFVGREEGMAAQAVVLMQRVE